MHGEATSKSSAALLERPSAHLHALRIPPAAATGNSVHRPAGALLKSFKFRLECHYFFASNGVGTSEAIPDFSEWEEQ